MKKQINFSIIIPVYNNLEYIERCIQSIFNQEEGFYSYEILLIDDCSTDGTFQLLKKLVLKYEKIRLYQTSKNSGPGSARNIGISNALNDWLLFLDSDDFLSSNALKNLSIHLNKEEKCDIVSYNWDYDKKSTIQANRAGGRYDLYTLSRSKNQIINDYLSLGMDGSVIYTLIKTELLRKNNIFFDDGYHEDVDFIFKVYFVSEKISILDESIYIKNNRKNSIVNTISQKHIRGFFRAYEKIFSFLKEQNKLNNEYLTNLYIGIVGIVASRLREIWFHESSNEYKNNLYKILYQELLKYQKVYLNKIKIPSLNTRFFMIFNYFISLMANETNNLSKNMDEFLSSIIKKSWSCYDIHNSIFLGPSEIRACCKRFFDEGKMKGDVVLLKENFSPKNILKAKKDLYTRINKGQAEECRNCPFLEFKEWGYIDKLEVEHISFEYHSICNMKCIYCSDKYYGGKKSSYEVIALIDKLIKNSNLTNCKSVVWGGGEPTLEKHFIPLLEKMTDNFPNIKQRVITNSTVFQKKMYQLINENKVTITTSIDAGTMDTFSLVRKNNNFISVFKNLKKYASSKPENITLKYIFMDENKSIEEIKNFVNLVKEYNLSFCNFQISFDFKKDIVDIDSAISMVVLYGLLNEIDARLVFFDDLLLQRLKDISERSYNILYKKLNSLGYSSFLINKYTYKRIVIWGAGYQTKHLLETSKILKEMEVVYLVDNDTSKINNLFNGYMVYNPHVLKDNEYPIYISAVQNSPKILEQYKKLGLNKIRLVKGLLL